ncbi:MAG TPA: adenylate/guanylate cyclase domain-containing protein, partial [Anaerolineales bacterium]|nr:adenylate/guanylate cyclase domain-containing protein [Anaerolineales bacterium]
ARKNLRQELWRIRKAISTQGSSEKDYFLADELTLMFNRDGDYWLDVAQIERPDTDLQSLTTNLALYQGELLPGFYEEWMSIERERVQSLFEARMAQLLEQLITNERWIAVEEWAERWLAFSGAREPAYRALMLASGARGDMAKVASLYQRCTDELLEQLGVEPSAETRALYDGLLKGARAPRTAIQPSGTITFLFTDIEGSTRLLEKLGNQYAAALSQHHEIMRTALRKWNGHEVDTQGDAFFVTFTRALDAVQCAADAQRAFAAHSWTPGAQLRVRMGLHTGEPLIALTGYVGMDVHRAARIGDVGHGGQVLLSQTTRDLVVQDLPQGLSIRDIGDHRLKDMKYPAPIYQLLIEGLPAEFPPLKTKFTGTEAPTPGEPPFKGLQYFEEEDSDLFFGRELLTAKLVQRLRESRFLSVVIGASGSGKSSLVRAGLLPALKKGDPLLDGTKPPKDSTQWHIHILTPTAHPLEALATELTRDSESVTATATLLDDLTREPRSLSLFLTRKYPKGHTLLVMDQFEELFTLCRDEFERVAFIDNLLSAITPENSHISLIVTLRADFYAHLSQYPELRELVARHQEYIGPMTPDELRRAMEEPAKRGHWEFEPGLVDLILRDVGDEPGALPLLSHALLETWKRRAGHMLTLKGYADAGGVHGAIAHTAEGVYQNLTEEEQGIARNIFLRLTELGEGTEDTRRRASFVEFTSQEGDSGTIRNVLNILADARLVTLSEDTAEVAHEALIREWPTLREWLNEDRQGLQLHRRLMEAARDWELLGRDTGALYRGAGLAQAREWAALNPSALNVEERSYLHASLEQELREQQEREEQQQRELEAAQKLAETERARAEEQAHSAANLRKRSLYLSVALAIAIVSIGVAVWFTFQLREQAIIAGARELGTQAVLQRNNNFQVALLLGIEAFHTRDLPVTRGALFNNNEANPQLIRYLSGHRDAVTEVAFSPDGKILASAGADNAIILWDMQTGQRVGEPLQGHTDDIYTVAFSPNGKTLASAGADNLVILWDLETHTQMGEPLTGHVVSLWPPGVNSVAFSPDGKILASGGNDKTIILWNVQTHRQLGEPLEGHSDAVVSVAFSPDGKTLASGSGDPTVILWDVKTQQQIGEPLQGHNGRVSSVAFSPDGRTLASGSDDNTIILWDMETHRQIGEPLRGHISAIFSVAFSPDGKTLASGSLDNTIILWDVETHRQIGEPLQGHSASVLSVAFSPDGRTLASGSRDSTVILWDAEIHQRTRKQLPELSGVTNVAFSPDGKTLALSSYLTTTIILGNRETQRQTGEPLEGHKAIVVSMAFSPDGKTLASIDADSTIILWDVQTHRPIGESFKGETQVLSIAFSPDSKSLVSGSQDQRITLWDVQTRRQIGQVLQVNSGLINTVTFSPNGKVVAVGSRDGIITLWDVELNQPIGEPLQGHGESVSSVVFSPDGKTLVSGSLDGTITLWDVQTYQPVGAPQQAHSRRVAGLAFSPDGKSLISGSEDQTFMVWDWDPLSWIQKGCQRAGRNFTNDEWKQYFSGEEYRKSCEQFPRHPSYYEAVAKKLLVDFKELDQIQKALDGVRREMESDSAIHDPAIASKYLVSELVANGIKSMPPNEPQEILNLLEQGESSQLILPPFLRDSNFLNGLCWQGTLQGLVTRVLSYCDQAVDLAPGDASIRDSRGLARALNGDYVGAIEDFQFFVDNEKREAFTPSMFQRRQQWIAELKAGRDPFTPEVLEELMSE